jgi:Acetyltransferase (GNAT) family
MAAWNFSDAEMKELYPAVERLMRIAASRVPSRGMSMPLPSPTTNSVEISVKGKWVRVPALHVSGKTIVVTGRWLKVAAVKSEEWQEGEVALPPEQFFAHAQQLKDLGADMFTFSQKETDPTPRFPFYHEWDSIAAIPVVSFSEWWSKRVPYRLRQDVKRAARLGVVVRHCPFTDDFVRAIMDIYDETPVRQGRPFWHYKKSFDAVKLDNSSYLERSDFLGAFLGDELIGFIKVVYVNRVARMLQILAKDAHRDKRPMNALIAKAVELCEQRGCSHLVYGNYRYAQGADSLSAFKHRNGFEEILVPRYYVPLTTTGRLALRLRLHRGAKELVPGPILQALRRIRAFMNRHSLFASRATP